jgi:hypothetical protein
VMAYASSNAEPAQISQLTGANRPERAVSLGVAASA